MNLSHLRRVLVIACLLIVLPGMLREASAAPDPAALVLFTAMPDAGQIVIKWETAFELNVAGFCVTRSLQRNGDFTRIPDCVISKGDGITGATYSIADTDVGLRYYYKLQVINRDGTIDSYGPISVGLTFCDSVSEIPRAECEALVALYSDTAGKGWTRQDGWLESARLCSWYGVTCESGHVRSLSLPHNQLSGPIPPELGHLTELQALNFGSCDIAFWEGQRIVVEYGTLNRLDSAIPGELGTLQHLRSLNLNCAHLTGAIPPELGNLTGLSLLDLEGNQLNGAIPSSLKNLAHLQELYLNSNSLTGAIPSDLGQLPDLRLLDVGWNRLFGAIPPELGNLTGLQGLWLWNNGLSGPVPAQLGKLTGLQRLGLSNNPLAGALPRSLLDLKPEALYFDRTLLCEPSDKAFQAWLADIPYLGRTGVTCRHTYLPLLHRTLPPVAQPPFWADRYQLGLGECTTIHWSVTNAREVYLNDVGVPGEDTRQVCPVGTTEYVLRVERVSGTQEYRLTIIVAGTPATPTRRPSPTVVPEPTKAPEPTAVP